MAQPGAAASQAPRPSLATALNLRSSLQPRPSRMDTGSLSRYRGATSNARETTFHGSMLFMGASSARRRGALRELLGLQGAAPVGWPSEERAEEQPPSGPGGSGLCMDPREHAWMLAAAEGRFEELQGLLEAEPGLLLRGDPITGYTVLHWLAKHGRHEELILVYDFAQRRGLQLDMSVQGSGGLTPLHLAAQQGHDMVIMVLVGALGADPTRRDHSGHRACHYLQPEAPRRLRELSGAEDWELVGWNKGDNANNNSSSGVIPRSLRWSLSSTGATAAGPAREKDSVSSRKAQIQSLLHQVFPFFQDH